MGNKLHPKVLQIGQDVRDKVFPFIAERKGTLNLFLIGGKVTKDPRTKSLRARLRPVLAALPNVNVLYPEELFGDLIYGEKMDLLQLENLLANSVHAVVVCPESPGSLVELGAFSNHPYLCRRLIVVANKKFEHSQSFIRLGPLRYLMQKKVWNCPLA